MTPATEYKHTRHFVYPIRVHLPDPPLGYIFAAHGRPWGRLLNLGHGIPSEWRKKLREAGKFDK